MFMMYPHFYTRGFFGFSPFPFFLVLGVILLIWAFAGHRGNKEEEGNGEETALEILKKRYARGEITKRQFAEMKKDVGV